MRLKTLALAGAASAALLAGACSPQAPAPAPAQIAGTATYDFVAGDGTSSFTPNGTAVADFDKLSATLYGGTFITNGPDGDNYIELTVSPSGTGHAVTHIYFRDVTDPAGTGWILDTSNVIQTVTTVAVDGCAGIRLVGEDDYTEGGVANGWHGQFDVKICDDAAAAYLTH